MFDKFNSLIVATTLVSIFVAGAFGAFGSMTYYLYLVVKGRHGYVFFNMFIYMVLGVCIGIMVDRLMWENLQQSYRGIIILSGVLSMKIFDLLDAKGLNLLADKAGISLENK